jgi:Flp pilus assembly pilin Flp
VAIAREVPLPVIAAGIAVAIIAAVNGLGSQVKATFGSVSTAMK